MACRLIGRATNTVCEGELKQIASRGNFALDETEYLEVIEGKTASLCSCACRLGALYSGAPADVVERLASYGRNIGIAFQIADDLLDLLGDERTTGKSLGTDLQKQKPTLPLIRTLELADDADRDELLTMLATETVDVKDLLPWFERYDALQYTRDRAAWFAEQARVDLGILDPSPALEVLRQITAFVVARSS